ncbi:uncharacterized protein [Heptranchias perlo]|uniref:uncharacterized protein n=1 Tax=Heptranchias perlo TaxID=212740 RepID=UPI0035594754
MKKQRTMTVSKYCLKKLSDSTYWITIAALNVILFELAELCKCFQKSCLTTIEAVQLMRAKIRRIKGQYFSETVFWCNTVKNLIASCTRDEPFKGDSILMFVSLLYDHLEKRFPENELNEWSAFDFASLAPEQISYEFGTENIEKLVDKHRQILILGQVRSSGQNIMDEKQLIVSQYNDYKYLIAEKIETSLRTFQDLVTFTLKNSEQYNVVSQLVDIWATFQASSADCEHGFSLMNNIKTKS